MTVEEEVAALKKQVADLNVKVIGIDMVGKMLNSVLLAQEERLARDEHWLLDVSAIARHSLEHSTEKMKAVVEEPASPRPKSNQRDIEVA